MNRTRALALVFGLLYLAFIGYLAASSSKLPERMATHFGGGGQPDGWMSRGDYVRFMMVFGLVFPLFVPAICYVARFLPKELWNIPHRDYWFAPERRRETLAYLFDHSLWLAPLMVAFVIGMHFTTVRANSLAQPQLSMTTTLAMAGLFLVGVAIWLVHLIRHLNRVP